MNGSADTGTGFAAVLARWAADAAFDARALAEARLCLLDTLACMIAGADEPAAAQAAAAMRAAGAGGACAHVGGGERLSAPAAALVNGTAAHTLDWDDYEVPGSTHPSPPIVPALLALSDLRSVTLGEVAAAYVVGFEAIVRMGRALGGYGHYLRGWHATGTIGVLGAAAAAAQLIGLGPDRFAQAVSLAMSESAGLKAQIGTDSKPLHAGLAARAGLEAALLAEAGLSSNPGAAEAPHGYLALYGGGEAQPEPARSEPGILADGVFRKPWPCCAYTHRAIEAALTIRGRPGFDVRNVLSGTIRLPEPFHRVSPFDRPARPTEARFSMTHTVAWSLLEGDPTPAAFRPEAIARGDVGDLVGRFSVETYELAAGLADMSPRAPDTVTLRMADGSAIEETVADVKGGTANPMSEADIRAKLALAGGDPALAEQILADDGGMAFRFADVLRNPS